MTEQEAIRILHPDTTREALAEINDYKARVKAVDDACLMGCKALEKQIPKKPDIEGDGYCPEGNLVYDTWICPNCETHYEIDYDDYDYCPKCGQAIDKSFMNWSEEE